MGLWRLIALTGAVLVVAGASAFYIDLAAHFDFDFIEHHYDAFGMSILLGVLFSHIGCIGWARMCSKQRRTIMAGIVFIAPFALLLIGGSIGGTNMHGPAAIIMMLTIPATLLAVILLIMAAFGARRQETPA